MTFKKYEHCNVMDKKLKVSNLSTRQKMFIYLFNRINIIDPEKFHFRWIKIQDLA